MIMKKLFLLMSLLIMIFGALMGVLSSQVADNDVNHGFPASSTKSESKDRWEAIMLPTTKQNEVIVSFTYTNNDDIVHKDVKVGIDNVGNFEVVPGSMMIKNKNSPNGATLEIDKVIRTDNGDLGCTIGNYAPGEQAVVTCHIRTRKNTKFSDDSYYFFNGNCHVGERDMYVFNAARIMNQSCIMGCNDYGVVTQNFKNAIILRVLLVITVGFICMAIALNWGRRIHEKLDEKR